MQALFKNKTILSQENYLHLVEFHQKKNNWKYYLYSATISILFIIIIAFQISCSNYFIAVILFCFFFAFLAYRFIEPYYKTKKELKSNKVQKNLVNYFFFYEKYFRVKNTLGNSKLKYYKLYKVYENDTAFYLYIDKYNSFIVEKSGFTIGTSKTFKSFIKSKVGFKFKNN